MQNCIATHESNGIDIIIALILNDINPLGKKRMDLVLELKVRPGQTQAVFGPDRIIPLSAGSARLLFASANLFDFLHQQGRVVLLRFINNLFLSILPAQNNASKLLLAIMESRHDSENAERILYNMRPKELVKKFI